MHLENNKRRILAIDFGDKRIGLALSDILLFGTANCWSLNYLNNEEAAINSIIKECVDKQVSTIILGYPISMSGEENEQTKIVKKFSEKLKLALEENSVVDVEIKYFDERLTSVEAERILTGSKPGSKLRGEDRRQKKDQISASIILNSFLSSTKR